MGQDTRIEWADHTFNPWWGCTKVSPGCAHCYAEAFDKRHGGAHWGPGVARRPTSDRAWGEPLRWAKSALAADTRARVFCASMADWCDEEAPVGSIDRLWTVIRQTVRSLDWMLLTKRPERIAQLLPADWSTLSEHVWLGTTVEDQQRAEERIPHLLAAPARIRFLSCEPLLGPVDLSAWLPIDHGDVCGWAPDVLETARMIDGGGPWPRHLHWIIAGGESGGKARPMFPEWACTLRDQAKAAQVAFHFKQWGEWAPSAEFDGIPLVRIGKKAAGRVLDGRTWDEVPT